MIDRAHAAKIRATYELFRLNELGVIQDPGKFEGEPIYVPFYWDMGLEGFADEDETDGDGGNRYTFYLDDQDKAVWPELGSATRLHLSETETGFIYSSTD